MRRINAAYDTGDAEALAAMADEAEIGAGALPGLGAQYEAIKAEVRELRATPLGQAVVATRRCEREGEVTPLEALDDDLQRHREILESVRDHAGAFLAGEVDIDEFLDGPTPPDVEADALMQLIDALGASVIDTPPSGSSKQRPRPRKTAEQRRARKANRPTKSRKRKKRKRNR